MNCKTTSRHYPVLIEPNGEGGYMASFRDIPEALTEGETVEEVTRLAQEALITAADFYIEDRRHFPEPSELQEGETLIELPLSVATKMLLLNLMVSENIRPAELARRMGITRQEAFRITDLHHTTKIDTLAKAFDALGKRLEIAMA